MTRAVCASVVISGLAGCAGYQAFREGQAQLAEGQVEPGLSKLKQALDLSSENTEYRRTYFAQRATAVNALLRQAEIATETGDFDVARETYAKVLRLDHASARALPGETRVAVAQRHWNALESSLVLARQGDLDAAISKTQQVLSEDPTYTRAAAVLKQLMRQQADRS